LTGFVCTGTQVIHIYSSFGKLTWFDVNLQIYVKDAGPLGNNW